MSILKIKQCLVDSYVDGTFGLSTAYENRKYDPVGQSSWAAVYIVPAQPSTVTLGQGGEDNHTGFMQIDLNYPTDEGDGAILAKAQSIRAYYYAGRSFTYSGQGVTITGCGISSGRMVDGWYRVSITVNWYARTFRPN